MVMTIPCTASDFQRLDRLEAGEPTKLGMCAGLDLSDAFLADPQFLADLLKRQLWDASDPVSTHEDPPLTLFKPTEPAPDQGPAFVLLCFELVLVHTGVGRREELLVERQGLTAAAD